MSEHLSRFRVNGVQRRLVQHADMPKVGHRSPHVRLSGLSTYLRIVSRSNRLLQHVLQLLNGPRRLRIVLHTPQSNATPEPTHA